MGDDRGIELDPVLIVEDNTATQQRLVRLLGQVAGDGLCVAAAVSIAAAKALVEQQAPALALIDIGLPDGSGIELIDWLCTRHPQATVVVISAWGDEETVLGALRAGAIGYLLKEREDAELEFALQSIRRGGAPIDPFVARRILTLLPSAAPHAEHDGALTERETGILELVARGHSNREIAEKMELSRFTIEGYTKAIYRKLAVRSRTAAVFEAKSRGLLR